MHMIASPQLRSVANVEKGPCCSTARFWYMAPADCCHRSEFFLCIHTDKNRLCSLAQIYWSPANVMHDKIFNWNRDAYKFARNSVCHRAWQAAWLNFASLWLRRKWMTCAWDALRLCWFEKAWSRCIVRTQPQTMHETCALKKRLHTWLQYINKSGGKRYTFETVTTSGSKLFSGHSASVIWQHTWQRNI